MSTELVENTQNCESEDRSGMGKWAKVLRAKHPNQGKKALGVYLNRGRAGGGQKSKWQTQEV